MNKLVFFSILFGVLCITCTTGLAVRDEQETRPRVPPEEIVDIKDGLEKTVPAQAPSEDDDVRKQVYNEKFENAIRRRRIRNELRKIARGLPYMNH